MQIGVIVPLRICWKGLVVYLSAFHSDIASDIARAFLNGNRRTKKRKKMRIKGKNKKNILNFEQRMRKVEVLSNRDCEAVYSP